MRPQKQVATKFVPPPSRPQPLPPMEPMRTIDISAGWQGVPDESRDSVSAQDRSKAFLVRNAPLYLAVTMMASGVTILYGIVAVLGNFGMPWQLDKLLVFVAFLSATLAYVHVKSVTQDYEHSRAGVERHKIEAMKEIGIAQIQADRDLRLESMKMITRREDE